MELEVLLGLLLIKNEFGQFGHFFGHEFGHLTNSLPILLNNNQASDFIVTRILKTFSTMQPFNA
jgi:hypothetical protein